MLSEDLRELTVYWHNWLKHEKRLASNTFLAYERDLNSFFSFLKDYESNEVNLLIVKKIDKKTIRSFFFFNLEKGFNSRSNARSLSSIKSFFSFLIKKNIISYSNIVSMSAPKFNISLPRPLSINQVNKIISSLKNNNKGWVVKRNLSIILLMWGFGLRINEVLSLKLKDIRSKDSIYIKGKGGKNRLIPIFPEIYSFIESMIKSMPFDIEFEDFVFIGEKGKKLHPSIIQKKIRDLRIKLSLPENTTPHSFRHTFATHLLENMVDLRSIQELLGHESLSSTQKYTEVTSGKLQETIKNFHPRSSRKL